MDRKVPAEDQPKAPVIIRPMVAKDADRVAALATQLGYPSTPGNVHERFERIAANHSHAVFVAGSQDRHVDGWVHVFVCHLMESDPYAEIGGLVVDERCRGSGIGQRLLERAETWARAKGCGSVRLRSNIIRKAAHEFYLKRGYTITKTQHAFAKTL